MDKKPVEPPKHKQRYGVGQIVQHKNFVYIATTPLILKNFAPGETVFIASLGSINHFHRSIEYYMDLYLHDIQRLKALIASLEAENQHLKGELSKHHVHDV